MTVSRQMFDLMLNNLEIATQLGTSFNLFLQGKYPPPYLEESTLMNFKEHITVSHPHLKGHL